eukprot:GHUV01012993.1.p1 GENE.GHUV01012993.1~~GHUV01012993.1.p1  ORF type:complete len:390 (+),score=129.99 GHUV01012993.1:1071-2240(+)
MHAGPAGLTSDVGWGCTIRSGQMMMAEALARCWWGRTTRMQGAAAYTYMDRHSAAAAPMGQAAVQAQAAPQSLETVAGHSVDTGRAVSASTAAAAVPMFGASGELQLLQLFVDEPRPSAPFSIHNICKAGKPHGIVVGQWLGPWVLCKALSAAATAHQNTQHQQQEHSQCLDLQVHVVCDPGGGAPTFDINMLRALMAGRDSSEQQQQDQQSAAEDCSSAAARQQQSGLLILVPLTLGVGKVNELYLPQLAAILTFPQSVGIVGGRPGSSLYFLGVQGHAVMYLDPHEAQQMPVLPDDVATFHCCAPRLMPLTAIDPSLAIGFYCKGTDELDDLGGRLQKLMLIAGGAPLMTVVTGDGQQQRQRRNSSMEDQLGNGPQVAGAAEDWELV